VTKRDDCSLERRQRDAIRRHAKRALEAAGAIGVFPTPVAAVMEAAKVFVAEEDALSESFLQKMRKKASRGLKAALAKVLGVLDVAARIVYLDKTLYVVKQTFLKLHETAHAVLPWQRDLYVVAEDCEQTIAPEVSEEFEREANVFASDVLFQLDNFTHEAADFPFSINVPLRLSKKFGASIYATVRRYVSENHRACAVLVLNPPELKRGPVFVAELRRVIVSAEFERRFGSLQWPQFFEPSDPIGAMVPIGRRMSRPRTVCLVDRNKLRHEFVAEAFTQTHQVFVLIHAAATLTRRTVLLTSR